jgi:palmitoyl-protein thioesterase
VSDLLDGVYTVCIPTGKSQSEDTSNGYFLSMNANTDIFAANVRNDPTLQAAGAFHAIGFSQGNNVIRGYIARYNGVDQGPTVHTFLSINGVNAGIASVPSCRPSSTSMVSKKIVSDDSSKLYGICDLLNEQASNAAYTDYAQKHNFQANYWRDPRPSIRSKYQQYSQLAVLNNEASDNPDDRNMTLNENWARTEQFVWVLATSDELVWPQQGEWWGCPDSAAQDPYQHILDRRQTPWYQHDLFGLRAAEESGKNKYESFVGNHLQFNVTDFERWITTYLTPALQDARQESSF